MRKPLYFCTILIATLTGALLSLAQFPPTPPTVQRPLARHAIIISIDGCRPDVLLRANTPVIHNLILQSSFTFYAETTDLANTLPSHTSMMTGCTPEHHGINFNSEPDDKDKIIYPKVPTVLQLAHAAGLTTGVFSTKSKFIAFAPPNTVDYVSISKESSAPDDLPIARDAAQAIIDHKPGAMLIHFGGTDKAGHAKGWGSPEQMTALQTADTAVGLVVAALKQAGIYNDTLIIISSDHGGSGTTHGTTLPSGERDWRSRYIPWIAVGPGVAKNFDLTSDRRLSVHTEDTFATACYFLGLPLPANIDGKPITRILKGPDTKPATTKAATTTQKAP